MPTLSWSAFQTLCLQSELQITDPQLDWNLESSCLRTLESRRPADQNPDLLSQTYGIQSLSQSAIQTLCLHSLNYRCSARLESRSSCLRTLESRSSVKLESRTFVLVFQNADPLLICALDILSSYSDPFVSVDWNPELQLSDVSSSQSGIQALCQTGFQTIHLRSMKYRHSSSFAIQTPYLHSLGLRRCTLLAWKSDFCSVGIQILYTFFV